MKESQIDIRKIENLNKIEKEILDAHPILKYRIEHIASGVDVRGLKITDAHKCAIVLDDSVIAGSEHWPCVIYMREGGNSIGYVSENMRTERKKWHDTHNTYEDPICKKSCLDVCISYNNKYREFHK